MAHFDVFNGDADGICSLHQLRLSQPREAQLITGAKRDIALLGRVKAHSGDSVTVMDVSIDANRSALMSLLADGVEIAYFDHHFAGTIPESPHLHAMIDLSPSVCTSLLVARYLKGKYGIWAVVGAFGDNLDAVAYLMAARIGLKPERIATLRELGENLNYNAYGDTESDLLIHPASLYAILHRYTDPFRFINEEPLCQALHTRRISDMEQALKTIPFHAFREGSVYVLPDVAWSRRVRGAFANRLSLQSPDTAFAILTPNQANAYTVSVRTPLRAQRNAQQLCGLFPTGGGRSSAAGINSLPAERLADFMREFEHASASESHASATKRRHALFSSCDRSR